MSNQSDVGRLIEVEWHDSERVELGWESAQDYIDALNDRRIYRTAGYFIGETEAGIMVANSRSEDNGTFNAAMVIPVAVVKARRWLSESPSEGKTE